jgi:hypothetical protein
MADNLRTRADQQYTRQDVDQLVDEITGKFQGQIATYQKALQDVAQATEHSLVGSPFPCILADEQNDRRGHEHDLVAQLQQTQTLLAEAKAQLHVARTAPTGYSRAPSEDTDSRAPAAGTAPHGSR